jgi:Na+/proline symporter
VRLDWFESEFKTLTFDIGALVGDTSDGSIAFFLLLGQLPSWVVGIVIVMTVALSTAAFDSFQSAIVSTGSNDIFRNRLNFWYIRAAVVLIIVPAVVVALKSPSILQIYLISDLVSASSIPVLVIGLSSRCYWWRGFEVVVGGLGGIFTVFLYGLVYYQGDARQAGNLILLEQGLYNNNWSAFGKSKSFDKRLNKSLSSLIRCIHGSTYRWPVVGFRCFCTSSGDPVRQCQDQRA